MQDPQADKPNAAWRHRLVMAIAIVLPALVLGALFKFALHFHWFYAITAACSLTGLIYVVFLHELLMPTVLVSDDS